MASGLMDQVREQATSQAQDKKQTIVTGLHSVAEAIRHMSDHLSENDKGPVAQYAAELGRSLGNKIDNLTRYMEGRDVRQIADDLHDFARRRPAVFLGSAMVLGIAVSRFLKSSRPASSRRYDDGDYGQSQRSMAGQGQQSYPGATSSWKNPSSSVVGGGLQSWSTTPNPSSRERLDPSSPEKPVQWGTYNPGERISDDLER